MPGHDIIVVGASAGGVESLCGLVQGLPSGLPATLFVVCHFPPGQRSVLPEILSRHGRWQAAHARDGEPIYPGRIYVAPPDAHLLLEPGVVRLDHGARENRFRPAIDPLFRSAARRYQSRVVGVLLSGALTDGVAGLLAVRGSGGVAVIQDPRDAVVASLPRAAVQLAGADYVVTLAQMPPLLVDLVNGTLDTHGVAPVADAFEKGALTVDLDMQAQQSDMRHGKVSVFTCPECGGCLWQLDENEALHFRCHVGHVYEGQSLLADQSEALEAALWSSLRTFREKSVLARQLATVQRNKGDEPGGERFEEEATLADHYAELIRHHILQGLIANRTGSRSGAAIPAIRPDESSNDD